jgi:hypothetical protein
VVVDWLDTGVCSAVSVVVVEVVEVVAAGVSVDICVDVSVASSSWPSVAQEQSMIVTTLARFLTSGRIGDLQRTGEEMQRVNQKTVQFAFNARRFKYEARALTVPCEVRPIFLALDGAD